MTRLKDKNLGAVDRTQINGNRFKGWRMFVWIMFGDRRYLPNNSEPQTLSACVFALVVSAILCTMFIYLPFKWLFFCMAGGATLTTLWLPVQHANQSRSLGFINLAIGALGLFFKPAIPLTVFGYSLIPAISVGFIISGGLSILRRSWNYLVWQYIGRLMVQYCKEHHLFIPSKIANKY